MAFCYPHGRPGPGPDPTLFCDWPNTPFVKTGYSVPAVGEASRVFAAQRVPHAGRLHFAGEHTSSGFFGYMEGALQSGARAARDVVNAVAVPCPKPAAPPYGPWMT
jgi:monoamine oxidase